MGFLTGPLYIVLSFAVGTLLIAFSMQLIDVVAVSHYLYGITSTNFAPGSPRIAMLLGGITIILFALRYIQMGLRRSRRDRSIRFESSQGTVSITLYAIEDMLKKMLEDRAEVSHVRPKVSLRKKGIDILIRGVLNAEVNLVEFTQTIQEKIKEKMDTFLGEDKDVRVNLEIRKVSVGQKKNNEGVDEEPEVPFRRYD